jgi:hypothetical protein
VNTIRERLITVLEELDSTVHPGSPRAISDFVCHAEVPDAVDAVLAELQIDPEREA